MESFLTSWEEIRNHIKNGEILLYDGLSGRYFLEGNEIYLPKQWPHDLTVKSYSIDGREVFGIMEIEFACNCTMEAKTK